MEQFYKIKTYSLSGYIQHFYIDSESDVYLYIICKKMDQ